MSEEELEYETDKSTIYTSITLDSSFEPFLTLCAQYFRCVNET